MQIDETYACSYFVSRPSRTTEAIRDSRCLIIAFSPSIFTTLKIRTDTFNRRFNPQFFGTIHGYGAVAAAAAAFH